MPVVELISAQNMDQAVPVVTVKIENDHADFADVEVSWPAPGLIGGGGTLKLHVLSTLDGTDFEDGSPTVLPEEGAEAHVFIVRSENIDRRMIARKVPIPPTSYKYCFVWDSGTDLTLTVKELKPST